MDAVRDMTEALQLTTDTMQSEGVFDFDEVHNMCSDVMEMFGCDQSAHQARDYATKATKARPMHTDERCAV